LKKAQLLTGFASSIHHSSFRIHHFPIVLAGDARAITAELVAAAGEGLRWSGCDVIDIGPATAACLAYAIHHLQAAGGVLVGNPGSLPHIVGLQFWAEGPRPRSCGKRDSPIFVDTKIGTVPCPLSAGGSLEQLEQLYQSGVERPARSYGRMSRFQADVPYLAAMSEYYHALRPLRVVVDSASQPLVEYLHRLASATACRILPSRVARHELAEQVRADSAHLAVCIDGDGETCQVFDDQGRAVSAEQLLLLLARGLSSVVLETGTSAATIERLERLGLRVTVSRVRRAEMAAAMKAENAILGGGPSGRFWHSVGGVPLPDALLTVTRLLVLLSRGDEPFSAVLDREAPLR